MSSYLYYSESAQSHVFVNDTTYELEYHSTRKQASSRSLNRAKADRKQQVWRERYHRRQLAEEKRRECRERFLRKQRAAASQRLFRETYVPPKRNSEVEQEAWFRKNQPDQAAIYDIYIDLMRAVEITVDKPDEVMEIDCADEPMDIEEESTPMDI